MAIPRWNQVTERDAAVMLGIKIDEVRALIESKLLRATYTGRVGGYTIRVDDLEEYRQSRTKKPE